MISFNRVGRGICNSSFGEIIQGCKITNENFLISLPIKLISSCKISLEKIQAPLIVECSREKRKNLITILLQKINLSWGYYVKCSIYSDIPISKGLSSSTADMVAAVRAIENLFNVIFDKNFISQIFKIIEPHEGLHYEACNLYDHVKGKLLIDFKYIPDFYILAIDRGGFIDTLEYNKTSKYSLDQKKKSEKNLKKTIKAFKEKNDIDIAKCATTSSKILAERLNYNFNIKAIQFIDRVKSLGLISSHSGTFVGFIYEKKNYRIQDLKKYKSIIEKKFKKKVKIYETVNYVY